MRKLNSFMILLIMVLMASCSNSNTPETVATKFNIALYKADFEVAKGLCTEDTRKVVDFIAAMVQEKVPEMKKSDIKYKTKDVKLAEDGNSAEVEGIIMGSIDMNMGGVKDSVTTKLHMVKLQDKWLVQYKLK